MNNSFPDAYFMDGGTLRANTPSYVTRPADAELLDALLNREYCYILTPRQMGKSSLMIRTSQRLKDQNIQTAVVDIQGIGTNKVREWYASLLSRIRRGLKLSVDIDEWMTKKSNVGFGQLFSDFIQDVVLAEVANPVVIFLDEVDWMIKIDFRDDFFASIRSMYNARAQYPEFNRISFVLLGVASPADLISEPTRTPFNIGHSIPLQELSLKDATPLQDGLEQVCPGEGARILDRIFYWTNGHPYLTQKICKTIAEAGKEDWSDTEVDDLVHRLFLAEESRKEANLKFIQDRILSNEQFGPMLRLYKRVRHTKVKENGQSILQNQLMLSGLLTSRDGYVEVRNLIYLTVFNDRWINRNTPKNWQRAALISMSSLVILLLAVIGYNSTVSLRLKTYQTDYIRGGPGEKITALANIYRLQYLFSANTYIDATAAQAFYEFTPDSKTQLSLFPPYGENGRVKQQDLVTVIGKLYVTLANVDEENDNTSLLQAMDNTLQQSVLSSRSAKDLQQELDDWISGRTGYKNKDYVAALTGYSDAISINSGNQATLYERAKVYVELGQYENALKDLNAAIGAAQESAPDVPTSTSTNSPVPLSETPAPRVTETLPLDKTATVPLTATFGATSTSIPLTQSPTLAPSIKPVVVTPDKFESNFTTLNHVIVAVKTLVDGNPKLQEVLLRADNSYSNLDFLLQVYARIPSTPTKFTATVVSALLNDDFSDSSIWGTLTDSNNSIEYAGNALQMIVYRKNWLVWSTPNADNYQNVHMEVTVKTNDSDPTTAFGLMCNKQSDGASYYYFVMTPSGEYVIARATVGQSDLFLTNNNKWGKSDLIARNASSYLIAADCGSDGTLALYVDEKKIDSVDDTTYANGEVGLITWSGENSTNTKISFDDYLLTGTDLGSSVLPSIQRTSTPAINMTQAILLTPGSTIQHQVVEGEWLVQIARCFGADLSAVQNANSQITDANASLLPGTIVTIPNIGSNGTIYGPPCITSYTVQAGDTWSSIAAKFNVDVLLLQAANSSVTLSAGVIVKIPLGSQTPATGNGAIFTITTNVNCRAGPSTAYAVLSILQTGASFQIIGRTVDEPRWWAVRLIPPAAGFTECWVADFAGTASGSIDQVPVMIAPVPTSTANATTQGSPTLNVTAGARACNDGVDNDGDGLIDLADPQCRNGGDDDESQ